MNLKTNKLIIFVFILIVFFIQSYKYLKLKYNDLNLKLELKSKSKLDYIKTRDFMRYECKKMMRIGGPSGYIKNAPHSLYRIDGAWFICLDEQLAFIKHNCNILSFGINIDYTFDEEMNKNFGCHVFSFDPLVEAQLFANIRAANKDLSQAIEIKVNSKWSFYKYSKYFLVYINEMS